MYSIKFIIYTICQTVVPVESGIFVQSFMSMVFVRQRLYFMHIIDFGFAQYLAADDQNSSMRGSPLYMAPEILLKKKYDARVDIWSVGVIMYECLFGRAPYSSSNFRELAEKIKSQLPIQVFLFLNHKWIICT